MKNPSNIALSDHYSQALGLSNPWRVDAITLDTSARTLDIEVAYADRKTPFPESPLSCPIHGAGVIST